MNIKNFINQIDESTEELLKELDGLTANYQSHREEYPDFIEGENIPYELMRNILERIDAIEKLSNIKFKAYSVRVDAYSKDDEEKVRAYDEVLNKEIAIAADEYQSLGYEIKEDL